MRFALLRTPQNFARDAERMRELEALFHPLTGHCCPDCASAEYRALREKNYRRWQSVLGHRGLSDEEELTAAGRSALREA